MSTPWHDEAHELLNSGVPFKEVARRMHRSPSALRWALDIDGERRKCLDRTSARRKRISEGPRVRPHVRAAREVQPVAPPAPAPCGITLPFVSFLADHESPLYRLARPDYFERAL